MPKVKSIVQEWGRERKQNNGVKWKENDLILWPAKKYFGGYNVPVAEFSLLSCILYGEREGAESMV